MKSRKKHIYFMIRLIKYIAVLILMTGTVHGQDLFNEFNANKFADYLFKTQQFNLAAQEYERLVFLAPANTNYKLSLIQSYRYSGDLTSAQKRLLLFFGDSLFEMNQSFGTEYLKTTIMQDNLPAAQTFIKKSSKLDDHTKLHYQTCVYLLESKWPQADSLIKVSPGIDQHLVKLTNEATHIKYKKPFLAASLSTILPGSGKAYCGYWKDGLISVIFIGANAWQTYRGFSKYGVSKPHGWIFGGITAGFYFGNIYGSWKAAKRHNKKANDKIHNDSKNFILSTF